MTHSSYQQYFSDLKSVIKLNMKESGFGPKIGKDFEKILMSQLLTEVKQAWKQYSKGNRSNYMLTEDELECLWEKSTQETVSESLSKLMDLNMIKMSINSKGEILYSATEDGLRYLASL